MWSLSLILSISLFLRMETDAIVKPFLSKEASSSAAAAAAKNGISAQAIFYNGGEVTPEVLKSTYGIVNSTGSSLASQAVFSTTGQTFSPSDLTAFQTAFDLPYQSIAAFTGEGHMRQCLQLYE